MADDAVRRRRARHPRARARRPAGRLRGRRRDPRRPAALVVRRQGRTRTRTRTRSLPELVAWLDERARARAGCACGPSTTDDGSSTRFAALGFAPVRHSYRMEIDSLDDRARARRGRTGSRLRTATAEATTGRLRGRHRGLAGHERPDRRDLRGVGALDVERDVVRPVALVPRLRGRRARGLLALPRRTGDPNAATSACSACAGRGGGRASAGAARPLVRRVPARAATRAGRSASTRRAHRRDAALRAGRDARRTATRSSSSGRSEGRFSA